MSSDKEIILSLGGPSKVAKRLGYKKDGGAQRVHNWMNRGIPAQVKIDNPDLFLRSKNWSSTRHKNS